MRTALLSLTMCLLALPANAKYSGGTGEPNDPYQLATAADLIALGNQPNHYGKYFILTADIDLNPKLPGCRVFDKAVIAPEGTSPFTGAFNGNGHTISHLTIKGQSNLGLFGQLGEWPACIGEVKNLGVVDVNITGSGDYVGGLAGVNDGTVTQCYSTATVNGTSYVGGLVGLNGATLTQCYSTATVNGTSYVGGLVGLNGATVTRSYSIGLVTGTQNKVGGLVGYNGSSVTWCYSTAMVNGNSGVGGLVGDDGEGTVTHCYSTGAVRGENDIGGLVGSVGSTWALVLNSVWDMETSGLQGSSGGVGLTTAEMMDPYMVGLNGFANDPNWVLDAGRDYPRLAWEGTPGSTIPDPRLDWLAGQGTAESPFRVDRGAQLILLGKASILWDRHYGLGADIDLDPNLPNVPIFGQAVIGVFTGVFDGNGHTISHLTMKGGGYLGLFAQLGSGADVKDLGVVDVNIAGSGGYVGGLVGESGGSVTQCWSAGAVSGGWSVGGLVGSNSGSVTWCYSTGVVTGTQYDVGGLVGFNVGGITDSHATGNITGSWCVGGLVGSNGYCMYGGCSKGTISDCYSAGEVSGESFVGGLVGANPGARKLTGCFWDLQTSGQATSAGGTGKTTAEMQTASTFLNAGWDFVGETTNGTEDIWWILEGTDYPQLWWLPKPKSAFSPNPRNRSTDVSAQPTLSWSAVATPMQHDVYLGDNERVVFEATTETLGVYRGRQAADMTAYSPGNLEWGKTYYWRIDEVNEGDPNSRWKGTVWCFTTIDFTVVSVVDDFESYTDDRKAGQAIFQAWLDGCGYGDPNIPAGDANNPPYYPGNGTGSYVGNWYAPFAEQTIVHAGEQSMPMDYSNVYEPRYSEAERMWETTQDWTIDRADTLTSYFRGEPNNSPEPLYVGVEDNAGRMAVVVHPDPNAVLASEWQKWHIGFADLRAAGVDVAAVKKMVIGVGDRQNPKPGGTGRIYIDDIRLTKRMP